MKFESDSSPEELDLVWPKYGLRESPYSTSPMRLLGILPIEKVFSGRVFEVNKLKKIITSLNSSRTLIVGDFGVGKTTFTNYVRWLLSIKGGIRSKYLTINAEIKVQKDWDATKFLLSTLSAIYTSSIIFDWKSKGLKLKSVEKLKDYVSVSKQKNYQGSLAGFGGGFGSGNNYPLALSPEILEDLLIMVCKEIMENGKQIILLYDNLENIELEKLADIFKSIRDYIQFEGLHTLFLGPPDIISALESHGQVHSVFGQPFFLNPLTENNVLEILKKRCEALKSIQGRYLPPYDEKMVKDLYQKLNCNIRFTFKVLEDTTIISEAKAPCKITMDEIKVVQEKEKKEILSTLSENPLKIITALLTKPKLSQRDLSIITKIGETNLTSPLRELKKKGLITINKGKKDKRIKWVKLSDNSYLKLFFISEEVPEKKDKELDSYLGINKVLR